MPPEMEEYVYQKMDLMIESISPELMNAPEFDERGRRTSTGKILEVLKSRFPNLKVDPEGVVAPDEEVNPPDEEVNPHAVVIDDTWTKADIVAYLANVGKVKGKEEEKSAGKLLKKDLIAWANSTDGQGEGEKTE